MSEEQDFPENKPPGEEGEIFKPAGMTRPGGEENIPIQGTSTNPKPETSNPQPSDMETHANHLHHAPGKKFWHYFYEFLMLFLAVFCGFIAENMREHYIEQQREKKYILSLIEDIKSDTAQLHNTIHFNRSRILVADSLLTELSSDNLFTDCRRAYNLAYQSGFWDFITNDGTIQQLKSSGGLRLIRNQKVVDNIMAYDKRVKIIYGNQDIFNQFMITLTDNNLKFFPTRSLERQKNNPFPILSKEKSAVEIFYGMEYQYQIFLDMVAGMHEGLLEMAREFLVIIKKEYHLE